MEFAHGGALHSIVKRRPHLYPETLADWLIQVAGGMRYLHEEVGLVHRDLKTANSNYELQSFNLNIRNVYRTCSDITIAFKFYLKII